MREIGPGGLQLLTDDEGLRLIAYDDATGKVVTEGGKVLGKLTIGYGHTGPDVVAGVEISKEYAMELLREDLAKVTQCVGSNLEVDVSQNQFDALVCFTYNVGTPAFLKSTLLKKLNVGDVSGAAAEFGKWNKSRIGGVLVVMDGLKKRRADEVELFNKG